MEDTNSFFCFLQPRGQDCGDTKEKKKSKASKPALVARKPKVYKVPETAKDAQQLLPCDGQSLSQPGDDQSMSQLALTEQAQPAEQIVSNQQEDLLQPKNNDINDVPIIPLRNEQKEDAIDSIYQSMMASMNLGPSSGELLDRVGQSAKAVSSVAGSINLTAEAQSVQGAAGSSIQTDNYSQAVEAQSSTFTSMFPSVDEQILSDATTRLQVGASWHSSFVLHDIPLL